MLTSSFFKKIRRLNKLFRQIWNVFGVSGHENVKEPSFFCSGSG